MCPDMIDRIDDLSEQVLDLAIELEVADHAHEIEPLIELLKKEAGNLNAIYNEFCRLEMQD